MRIVIAIGILAATLVGCGGTPTREIATSTTASPTTSTTATTPANEVTPRLVFTIELSGGCIMAGPNCAQYRFWSDGTIELFRVGIDRTTPEGTAMIDPSLVSDVADHVMAIDLDRLRASLREGECRGCYDGIDTTFTYVVSDGSPSFASVDVELHDSVPLFAATWAALEEAQLAVGQLEPEMHSP